MLAIYPLFNFPHRTGTTNSRSGSTRFRCSPGQAGFFTKLGRLIKKKAKSDVKKIFSGFTKTRKQQPRRHRRTRPLLEPLRHRPLFFFTVPLSHFTRFESLISALSAA